MSKSASLFLLLLLTVFRASSQCLTLPLTLDERADSSEFIFEATVSESRSFWDSQAKLIYTAHTLQLTRIFKGNFSDTIVLLYTPGGSVGDISLTVTPSPDLTPGSSGIFMCNATAVLINELSSAKALKLELTSYVLGYIFYDDGAAYDRGTRHEIHAIHNQLRNICKQDWKDVRTLKPTVNSQFIPLSAPVISSVEPDTICAGCDSLLYIRGSGFLSSMGTKGGVTFSNSADGGTSRIASVNSHYVLWSDTLIIVKLPAKAGSGFVRVLTDLGGEANSSENLFIPYGRLNYTINAAQRSLDLRGMNQGGYAFSVSDVLAADTARFSSFLRALEQWRCGTGIHYKVAAITTTYSPGLDGINAVKFGSLSSGILGLCYSWRNQCTEGSIVKPYLQEIDIELANFQPYYYGTGSPPSNQLDFQTLVMHELGHGHQFEHVCQKNDFMFWQASYGSAIRNLSQGLLQGGAIIISRSLMDSFCSRAPMNTIASNTCNYHRTVARIEMPDVVCKGDSVLIQNVSSGYLISSQWTYDSSGTSKSIATSNPLRLSWDSAGSYAIRLVCKGVSSADTLTRMIRVDGKVTASSDIIGDSSTCSWKNMYYIHPFKGAASHTWRTDGGMITQLSDTSVEVVWDSVGTTKVYVKGINYCDSSEEVSIPVKHYSEVFRLPVKNGLAQIPDTLCSSSNYSFNSQIVSYPQKWQSDGIIVSPDSNQEARFRWNSSGNHTISHVAYVGCDSLVQLKHVFIRQRKQFSISAYRQNDSIHFSVIPDADSYNWYFGDGDSSNLPGPVHHYTKNNYLLRLMVGHECGPDTLLRLFDLLSSFDPDNAASFILYPNPVTESFSLKGILSEPLKLELLNPLGITVYSYDQESISGNQYFISRLEPGPYLCKITFPGGTVEYRILIIE